MTDVVLSRDVPLELDDGTVLRADVWRPVDAAPGPAILVRTPYLKEAMTPSVQIDPRRAADRGMCVVVQDVRGTGTSDGAFTPFAAEVADGAATVAWVRDQPWCDGRVVMAGMSYVGATQWMAARTRPDGLVAIAPTLTSDSYGEGWSFTNGVLELGFVASWSAANLAPVEQRWFDQVERSFTDHAGVADVAPWFPTWLDATPDGDYWRAHAVTDPLPAGELPAFVTAGLYDIFGPASIASFGRHPHPASRLVIGPWAHDPDLSHLVGAASVGIAGSGLAWDFAGRLLDWYDAVLAGNEPTSAPVTAYVLGARRWVELEAWPPPGATADLVTLSGGGTIDVDPGALPPSLGGRGLQILVPGWGFGVADQRPLAARPDVVRLTGAPLAEGTVWAGPAAVELAVTADGDEPRQWTATLCVEQPDGGLHNLAEGVAQAPSDAGRVVVPLGHLCVELPPGGRVTVLVAGGSTPRWRSPTTRASQTVAPGAVLHVTRAEL